MNDQSLPPSADSVMATLLANHRRFLQFLESRVGNREDAEEILQEAFVRTVHKAAGIDEPKHAVAWFYRLLRNAVIDHYRRTAAGERAREAYVQQAAPIDSDPDSEMERIVCECVTDLVGVLKPEYATIIRDIDLNGAEIGAVASYLGITAGNARTRLHRARRALRDEVERTCRTCATHGCLDCSCSKKV